MSKSSIRTYPHPHHFTFTQSVIFREVTVEQRERALQATFIKRVRIPVRHADR